MFFFALKKKLLRFPHGEIHYVIFFNRLLADLNTLRYHCDDFSYDLKRKFPEKITQKKLAVKKKSAGCAAAKQEGRAAEPQSLRR